MTKKLQIVRVDNDLVQKANLEVGNNIIGRSAVTKCNDDDRVFKHALTINLSANDEMTVTPVVPCYMKSAGCSRWQSLILGNSIPIKPDDICCLLSDKCWFKIISVPEVMEENKQTSKRKIDEDSCDDGDSKKVCLSSSTEAVVSSSETLNDIVSNKNLSLECQTSFLHENGEHSNTIASVSQDVYSASSPEGNYMPATCSKMSLDSQDVSRSVVGHEGEGERREENINLTKEPTTNVELEEEIKWDCDARINDQTVTVSPVEEDVPLPSTTQNQNQISDSEDLKVPKREKCKYGTRCFRKNINHKNNYSHPGDADYNDVDNREECPYGVKCYRKNPQHKAQFKHTAARRRRRTVTPAHVTANTVSNTDVSSAEESVDESDYEPSEYTESSDTKSDWEDSRSEWEDGTTG